jgi:hypothetical protein
MKLLTLEEFAWRCLWLECARLDQYAGVYGTRQTVRRLIQRSKKNELWQPPYFEKSEWAGLIRNWYADYLKTGAL